MWQGFKKFIVRGNVVDLAVGVIIGAAFGAIVKSMVEDVVTPTIGMLGERAGAVAGEVRDFSSWQIPGTPIMIGKFINALLNFLVQATVVYFFIVVPINKLLDRLKKDEPKALPDDIKLLTEIRDLLKAQSGRPGSSAEGVA
jgi:large conductance mechanosensitive channel